jgi:hypothetical protein
MTCSRRPVRGAATTGLSFQRASETQRPKPRRRSFWRITLAARWKAFISTLPTSLRLERTETPE